MLDFVGSDETLALAVGVARREAVVVQVGIGGGRVPFGIERCPEVGSTSSTLGSRRELEQVLDLAGRRAGLDWHVETLPLETVNEAHARLRAGDVLSRLVLVP